ncbi:hypothetical protein A1351_21790, partial [Methylosinus sp. R-45379]|uniref:hypothetical protein n=1 Tax=Methylosinus sp. R-45379 TaxID=980563 RepID=UPI0007C92D13
ARVIPIILRHCDWKYAIFGSLLAAPTDGRPIQSWPNLDEAFLNVVTMIRSALPASRPPQMPLSLASTPSSLPVIGREPRSSNLRISQSFTEVDKDRFLEDAFSHMSRFFANSLHELEARNAAIKTAFKSIDANRFTAVVYRDGKAMARCKIVLGGMFGKGISFSYNDQASDSSSNEHLSVDADEQGLYLKSLGMASMGRNRDRHLTCDGGSEYYWSLLMDPLQRTR